MGDFPQLLMSKRELEWGTMDTARHAECTNGNATPLFVSRTSNSRFDTIAHVKLVVNRFPVPKNKKNKQKKIENKGNDPWNKQEKVQRGKKEDANWEKESEKTRDKEIQPTNGIRKKKKQTEKRNSAEFQRKWEKRANPPLLAKRTTDVRRI